MPLLYDDEALVGVVSNKEQDAELRLVIRANDEAGNSRRGAEVVGVVGAEAEGEATAGDGDSFFRRKRDAGDLEANDHVHFAAPPRSESTTAHSSTEATTATSSLQQTKPFDANDNPSNPPGSTSSASSTVTLMDNHGLVSSTGLPAKRYDHTVRSIRWRILSVYRRLHLLVLIANAIAIIIIGSINSPGLFQTLVTHLATAATANILLGVSIRQELVINVLFIIFGHCPQWFPLRFRRLSAKIYHLGGVHSGAGIAGTVWFIFASVVIFKDHHDLGGDRVRQGIWAVTILLIVLLLAIIASSYPTFRRKYHDIWEWTHRFCGWTAIAAFWVLFVLLTITHKSKQTPEPPMWKATINSPIFWMLAVTTCCIIAPWLNLRRVPVTAEQLSSHVVRLHFTYTTPPLCSAPRLSDKPLHEWHAFASIPEDSGPGFSVLVSAAGDWTQRIIKDPPKYLWKRGWLARGVLNVAPIFKSMVMVVTGSGIGPVLSLLKGAPSIRNVRLVWSTKDPLLYYGRAVLDDVMATDPNAVVINTTTGQRPDLLELAHSMYVQTRAEAVFVISNPDLTRKVVYGLESRGVPAFAPIFDS